MIYSSLNGQVICSENAESDTLCFDKSLRNDQCLSILDRGLAYGDGVFTTARIVNNNVELLDEHLTRLWEGCQAIGLTSPQNISLKARLYTSLRNELIKESTKHALAVLKVIVTAGHGGRGYSRLSATKGNELTFNAEQINIIVQIHPYPEHYISWQKTGISVGVAKFQLGISPALAGVKHLNRLEQVLLRQELDARKEQDLLAFNCAGHLIEASASNVFIFDEQANLLTPKLSTAGVNGLMRQKIMKCHDKVFEVELMENSLERISAMFICNAVMGVVPVHTLSGKTLDTSLVKAIQSLHPVLQPLAPLIIKLANEE